MLTQSGLYSASLGSVTPLMAAVFAGPETFLGIKVGSDAEMVPRKQIGSVANAMVSAEADKLDGKDADEFLQDIIAGNAIAISNGSMATNATGPSATIAVAPNSINDDEIEDNSLTANSLAPNSVGSSEIANGAVTELKLATNSVLESHIVPNIVSSIDGVGNDGSNIDLVEGANITITPNNATNSITISASAGGSGGGVEQVKAGKNIVVTDPAGPTATVSLKDLISLGGAGGTPSGLLQIDDALGNKVVVLQSLLPTQSDLQFRNSNGTAVNVRSTDHSGGSVSIHNGATELAAMEQSSGGNGMISLSNASGATRAAFGVNTFDGGSIEINGSNNAIAANLGSAGSFGGTLNLFNDSAQLAASLSTAGGGFLSTYNSDGNNVVLIAENSAKAGFVGINSPNEIPLAYLTDNTAGGGFLGIDNAAANQAAWIAAGNTGGTLSINSIQGNAVAEAARLTHSTSGGGFFQVKAADGSEAIRLTTSGTGGNEGGIILVNNGAGQPKVLLGLTTTFSGAMQTTAADGSNAVLVSTSNDAGYVEVGNAAGSGTITLQGSNGVVFANQFVQSSPNNSRMAHPLEPSKEIYYGSLEGPEAAVYVRGTAQLVIGQARIRLPDHFSLVANGAGMTVQLTPRSASSEGLAVVERSTREIVVRELRNGSGSYEFDYFAHAVRQGYETFRVVRDKVEMSPHAIAALPDVAAAAVPAEATTASTAPRVAQAVTDALAAPRPESDKPHDRRQKSRDRK